jgi:hypothetical protein
MYGALVESYLTGKTESFGEKPVSVSLFPPKISHGMA